jgi:hypothetical protein
LGRRRGHERSKQATEEKQKNEKQKNKKNQTSNKITTVPGRNGSF